MKKEYLALATLKRLESLITVYFTGK